MKVPTRWWQLAFALAFVGATYLLLTPQPPDPTPAIPGLDKLKHVALFAVLALLALPAFPERRGWQLFAALLLYGLLTEAIQRYVPGRAPDVIDVAADAIGAAIVLVRAKR